MAWFAPFVVAAVIPLAFACGGPTLASPTPGPAEELRTEVIGRRPHERAAYTEGLVLVDGRLFESGGQYGASVLREVNPETGAVLRSIDIDDRYFAEGLAAVGDRLIQVTWHEKTAFVYLMNDFSHVGTFSYDTEGWGLCDDGSRLVMSDGTSTLYFRDRVTFELRGTVEVVDQGQPVVDLNELECVDGQVYANVYQTDRIVRIDPQSGRLTAVIDASGLLNMEEMVGSEVLNGIAYDSATGNFLLTGKYWPTMFEVRFVDGAPG